MFQELHHFFVLPLKLYILFMRNRKYYLMRMLPLLLLSAVLSCTDVPDSDLELQPTELKVRILDENYQQVTDQNAKVYLYRDFVSFSTKTGAVATANVGKNGYANFTDLEPYNYFIYAVFTEDNNVYDNSTSSYNLYDYLTENAVTFITVKTNLARSSTPTDVKLNALYVMPFDANLNWVGQDYDTVWTEYMVIKDYDFSKKVNEQTILARSTSYFPKKVKFGEFRYVYPRNGSSEPASIPIANLSNGSPSFSYYEVYIFYFAKKSDFLNRAQIYAETMSPTGYFDYEYLELNERLVEATQSENPYPQLLFLDQTYTQKNNYFIFTNLSWQ